MKKIFGFAISILILGFAGTAAAQVPAECAGRLNTLGYNVGFRGGGSVVDQSWNGVGQDPLRVDQMTDAVTEALANMEASVPAGASQFVICRILGLVEGALERLEFWQDQVFNLCALDGEVIGQITADLYCFLAEQIGVAPAEDFVRLPVGVCGDGFQQACEGAFADVGELLCPDFTEGVFEEAFEQAQFNQCTFEIGTCNEAFGCGQFVAGQCPDCAPDGICARTAEGGGICHRSISCSGLADCVTSDDCTEAGAVCLVNTCCGRPLCVPPTHLEPNMCFAAAPLQLFASEPTTGGF